MSVGHGVGGISAWSVSIKRAFAVGEGATFTTSAEVGLRHDGGAAETGTGLEVGAGLSCVAGALTVEG